MRLHNLFQPVSYCFIFLFFGISGNALRAQNYQYPVLKKNGANAEAFLPKGWHVMTKTTGDLNKDGVADLAVLIEADSLVKSLKEWENDQRPRILFAAFRQPDGQYSLSVQSNESILLSNDGGVFGDPFEALEINRGSIVVRFYGGSSDRWSYVYRWRYQNKDWFLIGATYTASSTHNGNFKVHDFNLLTGAAERTIGNAFEDDKGSSEQLTKTPFKFKKIPLPKLKTFKPMQLKIHQDIYI